MYPQNVTNGAQRKTFSARSTRTIVLYPILIVVALSVIAVVSRVYGDQ